MAPWHHGHQLPEDTQDAATSARNARYGLVLFAIYLLLYGAFVFVSAFAPQAMEQTPLAGVNLAVLSGLGLILAAFVLAILYGWLCRRQADSDRHDAGEGKP